MGDDVLDDRGPEDDDDREPEPRFEAQVELSLDAERTIWPAVPHGTATIRCTGEDPLTQLNADVMGSAPVVRVWAEGSDMPRSCFTPTPPDWVDAPVVTLEAGQEFGAGLDLAALRALPGPGRYEIDVLFRWGEGQRDYEQASARVPIEVVAAQPDALCAAPILGGPSSIWSCAWTDAETGTLRLSTMDLDLAPNFTRSVDLVPGSPNDPVIADLALSVPPHALPMRTCVAWTRAGQLHRVTLAPGETKPQHEAVGLEGQGWSLTHPLFEAPFCEDAPPRADALLVRETDGGKGELRAVGVDDGQPLGPALELSRRPAAVRSVYRSDGRRLTVLAFDAIGEPAVVDLWLVPWAPGVAPNGAWPGVRWPGELVDLDLALLGDERIVGAALMRRRDGDRTVLELGRFEVVLDDEFGARVVEGERLWYVETAYRGARVRVSPEGEPWVLAWGDAARWALIGRGEQRDVSTLCAGALPVCDLVFVQRSLPAVLCGTEDRGVVVLATGPVRSERVRPS